MVSETSLTGVFIVLSDPFIEVAATRAQGVRCRLSRSWRLILKIPADFRFVCKFNPSDGKVTVPRINEQHHAASLMVLYSYTWQCCSPVVSVEFTNTPIVSAGSPR